jgi:predicted NBD/HSP70 family sugar kinase
MTSTPGSQSALRAANRQRVLSAVARSGTLTQAEIARLTGLSPATVSNIVKALAAAGTVEVSATVSSGRRAQSVRLGPSAGLAAGVDFGRTHVRVALASLSHDVLAERELAVARRYPADIGVDTASDLLDALLADLGEKRSAVTGLGVGIPGPIDSRTGRVGSGSILPEWVGASVLELIDRRFEFPTLVDNDANLGALAEHVWGGAQGVDDLIYIKVSTGIGAGLVIGGKVYRGGSGTAGELGHITIDPAGPVCRCGNRGCLEMVASVPVIFDQLRHSHGDNLTIDRLLRLVEQGDIPTRRVIESAGYSIGSAVANLCNLLNPSVVVVGGELAPVGSLLLDPVREVVRRNAVPSAAEHVRVKVSPLGRRAQVLGALAMVLREGEDTGKHPVSSRSLVDANL